MSMPIFATVFSRRKPFRRWLFPGLPASLALASCIVAFTPPTVVLAGCAATWTGAAVSSRDGAEPLAVLPRGASGFIGDMTASGAHVAALVRAGDVWTAASSSVPSYLTPVKGGFVFATPHGSYRIAWESRVAVKVSVTIGPHGPAESVCPAHCTRNTPDSRLHPMSR